MFNKDIVTKTLTVAWTQGKPRYQDTIVHREYYDAQFSIESVAIDSISREARRLHM